MSQFRVEVVPVNLEPHPNADQLSLVKVKGFTVVVRTEDWKDGQLGCYIPPDSLVPVDKPEFAWLRKDRTHERIRVKKLRGVHSQGLLVPAPEGAEVGDDLAESLGVTHYEPPPPRECRPSMSSFACAGPGYPYPVYDVENYRNFPDAFKDESVEDCLFVVTEKIHGCNARYVYRDGKMHVGSRNRWTAPPCDGKETFWQQVKRFLFRRPKPLRTPENVWWRVLRENPEIEDWCRENPGVCLYAEIFGPGVQDLDYGMRGPTFRVFDAFSDEHGWRDFAWLEIYVLPRLPMVPSLNILWAEEARLDQVEKYAEGQSMLGGDHPREGCVIRSRQVRYVRGLGRAIVKVIGNGYLERE